MSLDKPWTFRVLRPLLYHLIFFGLCRPFKKSSKLMMTIFVITSTIQVYLLITTLWKIIVCFLGAENPTIPSNISLYIIAILVVIIGLCYFLYGMFYSVNRIDAFVAFTEELQQDPVYSVKFDKLKRNITIFIIAASIFLSIVFLVMLITNFPIFSNDYSCFFTPYNVGTPGYWIHISSIPVLSTLVLGQTVGIFGILTAVCYMIKIQLTVCNRELEKLIDSAPTIKKILEIRRRFFSIHRYCQLADNTLTPLIATNIANNFLIVCLYANVLSYGKLGPTERVTFPIIMLFSFFEIAFIVVSCTLVNEKMNMFIGNMKSVDIGFTYVRLFMIDRSAMLSIFGTLVTYIVLVAQLKPT